MNKVQLLDTKQVQVSIYIIIIMNLVIIRDLYLTTHKTREVSYVIGAERFTIAIFVHWALDNNCTLRQTTVTFYRYLIPKLIPCI